MGMQFVFQNVEVLVEQYLPQRETPLSLMLRIALPLISLGLIRHLKDCVGDFVNLIEQVDLERVFEAKLAS